MIPLNILSHFSKRMNELCEYIDYSVFNINKYIVYFLIDKFKI